jgi:predicted nucleotidyltransferase
MEETEQIVNISNILSFLKREIPDYTVQNVYLFGSRLFGYNKPSSDWDFICTVSGDYYAGNYLALFEHPATAIS